MWTNVSRVVVPAQVAFRVDDVPDEGLRDRKKARTRLAIEDAALELFAERGYEATTVDDIAERADVSVTTLFRYFPTKAEIVLSDHAQQVPALRQAILDRPAGESDLEAIRVALQDEWVSAIDLQRTVRKAQVIGTSPLLRGMSFERGFGWLVAITDALAQRHRLAEPDERCAVAARVALGVHGTAVEGWIAGGCAGDLAEAVDRCFEQMQVLSGEWSAAVRNE